MASSNGESEIEGIGGESDNSSNGDVTKSVASIEEGDGVISDKRGGEENDENHVTIPP